MTRRGGQEFTEQYRENLNAAERRRYAEAMKDANDGKSWTEIDVRGLMAALRVGDTIEEAAPPDATKVAAFTVEAASELATPPDTFA